MSTLNLKRLSTLAILCTLFIKVQAAKVDSLAVASASMSKTYKAAVVLPESYAKSKASYPVLYLLHGGGGHFSDWLKLTPDKSAVKNLADQYNLIIVMPEGETFGWYLDSPVDKGSQFETHVTKEVIPLVDKTYRTIKSNKGRVITGLSMGGHGAMYLSARHPDLFCAAGTMSGAMDMNWTRYKINEDFAKSLADRYMRLLGTSNPNDQVFIDNSIISMAETIKKNRLPIIIDCGVDDFLIDANRELHRRLVYNGTPHDYTEHPGAHTWPYWQNSLPYHVLFFHRILEANGNTVKN
ncbi:alpha/beta hydrolase-fold protein [Chryseolinea sp. T2]|uniref:alpha/beta hydrolase n=1 Tax=Chryseolinea sp. T2 TaxID=3129255 RepID=UPI003076ABD8